MKTVAQKSARQAFTGRAYKTGGGIRHILVSIYALPSSLVAMGVGAVRTYSLPQFPEACNDDLTALEAANDCISAATFSVQEGGGLVVPYGEFPQTIMLSPADAANARAAGHQVARDGTVMAVQVVDRAAAEAMANDLSGLAGKVRALFRGVPIYNGHPFHPDPSKRSNYPDKRAYGWVSGINVSDDGFTIGVKYNGLGAEAVNDAQFGYHSPQWRMELLPIKRGEPIRCRPFRLLSGGLTNEPNIPVPALAVANEESQSPAPEEKAGASENEDNAMLKSKLLELLKLKPEATDEEIIAALVAKLSPPEAEKKDEDKPKPEPTAEEKLQAANEATQRAVTAANEARVARVDTALSALITSGKATKAEADALKPKLIDAANEAAVATLLSEYEKREAAKQDLQSEGLNGKRSAVVGANVQQENNRKRTEAVNEAMKEITGGKAARPGDHEKAWNVASRKHPELF